MTFSLVSDSFSSNLSISDVQVTYSASGNALIQIIAGGETYQSGYDYDGSTLSIGNTITNSSGSNSDGRIGLVSQTNSNHILTMKYASSTSLSLTTKAESDGFATALKNAFGIGNGSNKGMTFQVGPSASDTINITIPGVTTALLFLTSGGTYTSISIDTLSNAETAQSVLSNSIYILESAKATVGSKESALNYTKASLESSKLNIEIARDNYTATDISSESAKLSKAIMQADINTFVLNSQMALNRALLRLLDR